MLTEIESFINWLRRRNPNAHTWRDYRGDLKQFAAVVGDRPLGAVTFHGVDRFAAEQVGRGLQLGQVAGQAEGRQPLGGDHLHDFHVQPPGSQEAHPAKPALLPEGLDVASLAALPITVCGQVGNL